MSTTTKTTLSYVLAAALFLSVSILFNVWLAAGCSRGAGIITVHGKVCAFK